MARCHQIYIRKDGSGDRGEDGLQGARVEVERPVRRSRKKVRDDPGAWAWAMQGGHEVRQNVRDTSAVEPTKLGLR